MMEMPEGKAAEAARLDAPEQQPKWGSVNDELASRIEKLDAIAQMLITRITPILRPSEPTAEKMMNAVRESASQVVDQCNRHIDHVDEIERRLSDALARVEV